MTIKSGDRFISASKDNYKDFLKINLLAGMLCNKLDYEDYFIAYSQDRLWFYEENGDKTIMKSEEVYKKSNEYGFWDLLYGYKKVKEKKTIYEKIRKYVVEQIISERVKKLNYLDEDDFEYSVVYDELNDINFLTSVTAYTIEKFYKARDESVFSFENKTFNQDCKDYIIEVKENYIDEVLNEHCFASKNYYGDGSSPTQKERSL